MTALTRFGTIVVVAVVALGLPFVASGFQSLELAYALALAMAILGLNVVTGWSGQISLGHGAFVAVGAYVAAILQHRYQVNLVLALVAAGIGSGALGLVVGLPALRLEGIYLALATFALAVAMPTLLKKPAGLTGGVHGIILAPLTSPLEALTDDQFTYLLCLAVAGVLFAFAWNLLRGPVGRALRSIRDSEPAASAFGVSPAAYKTLAFSLSAVYAGVAGALYGILTGFVSADAYPFQLSILLLVGAVIGGITTLEGAIFGGLIVEFLPIYSQQLLSPIDKQLANAAPTVVQGLLLLAVLLVARQGVAGLLRALGRRLAAARSRSAPPPGGGADEEADFRHSQPRPVPGPGSGP